MRRGIAPSLLRSQVENTAPWALEPGSGTWRAHLQASASLESTWQRDDQGDAYLALMLSAHFATVATFVPTDVDTHIRHHHWASIASVDALRSAAKVLDETDAWDPRDVSERVVEVDGGAISGHGGEWLAVRAGALGRALQLEARDVGEHLVAGIDAELDREAEAFRACLGVKGREALLLRVATTLAHNTGDLSRVVDLWDTKAGAGLRARYTRLGHDASGRWGGVFGAAGKLNKAIMAVENDRFLPLRKPRALRRDRALCLPIAPFLDDWGGRIATARSLRDEDRAEILGACLEGHEHEPARLGWLRAMHGMHTRFAGGLDRMAQLLPAKARKLVTKGPIRAELSVDEARFLARIANRAQQAVREAG